MTEIIIEPLIHATPHQEYRAEYYQQGIEAILVTWLNGGFKETVQVLTDILGVHLPQDLKESSNFEGKITGFLSHYEAHIKSVNSSN